MRLQWLMLSWGDGGKFAYIIKAEIEYSHDCVTEEVRLGREPDYS